MSEELRENYCFWCGAHGALQVDCCYNCGYEIGSYPPEFGALITKELNKFAEEIARDVIGEDEPCFRNGKQLKKGDAVEITFKTEKDMRESSLFIEANGKNNLRATQRTALTAKLDEWRGRV